MTSVTVKLEERTTEKQRAGNTTIVTTAIVLMENSLFNTGIRPIIDNHLLELSKEKRDYGDYWSASSAGYCMRKVIFDRLGVDKVEENPRKQRVFTAGHIFHKWIQELTASTGASVVQEQELINNNLMIKGHIDDLIKTDNGLILYDYKTQNSRAFSYKRPEMSHFHKMQLGTYMYMMRNFSPQTLELPEEVIDSKKIRDLTKNIRSVKEARILKISKDDLRMSEEQLLWTPDLEKEVYEYWSTINGYWKMKTMPECTCADFENGFMAKPEYNDYYYHGEPCSMVWYKKWKEAKSEGDNNNLKGSSGDVPGVQ